MSQLHKRFTSEQVKELLDRYSKKEIKDEIIKDLRLLKRSGVNIVSATADGKNAVRTALKKVFPMATFQRCLIHIQRYAETYITQKPKTKAGVKPLIKLWPNSLPAPKNSLIPEIRISAKVKPTPIPKPSKNERVKLFLQANASARPKTMQLTTINGT